MKLLIFPFCALTLGADALGTMRPWKDVATLSYVATAGNAEGQALGLSNDYAYRWSQSAFVLKAAALRVSSTTVERTAIGATLDSATVQEKRSTRTTAENYTLNARYDHRLKDKDRWYWFSGLGWERNRPAGLDNRYAATLGFGRIWVDSPGTRFRTDLGLGYTREQPLVEPVGFKGTFGTANLSSQLKQKFGPNADYGLDLSLVESLMEQDDYQGTLRQGLTVTLNRTLALKVGFDLSYRNRPNLIGIDAFTPAPPVNLGKVFIPARRLDSAFTTSLVLTF